MVQATVSANYPDETASFLAFFLTFEAYQYMVGWVMAFSVL